MMTLETAITEILNANNLKVFFINKGNSKGANRGINIRSIKFLEISNSIRENIFNSLKDYINQILEHREEVQYAINNEESKRHYYRLGRTSISNYYSLIHAIENLDDNRLNELRLKDLDNLNPNIYILRIIKNGKAYYAFTNYNPNTILKKTTFLGMDLHDLESEKMINIRKSIDCIYDPSSDFIYIFSKAKFEDIFNYQDDYEDMAKQCIQKIKDSKFITKPEILETICLRSIQRTKQLARIFQENKIDKLMINLNNIQKVLDDYKIELVFRNNQIIMTNSQAEKDQKNEVDLILKLLDLAYWQNALTNEHVIQNIPQYRQTNLFE